ncbi:hypothetical protein VQL36_16700 [Chengkuizengella sp. SCS-71B]|uniref:hypothetical protein n=1 Tax=Chengkuizengella sp. SCS-71B TaxID=3115290 RepID=UPI0032C21CD2
MIISRGFHVVLILKRNIDIKDDQELDATSSEKQNYSEGLPWGASWSFSIGGDTAQVGTTGGS